MSVSVVLAIIGGAVVIAAIVVIVISRRTHLRSWRLGIFYESEEHYDTKTQKEENESG